MIDLTPSQKKTVAAAITVLAFSLLVAFVLAIGWVMLKFLSFASPAVTPVIVGLSSRCCSSRTTSGSEAAVAIPRCLSR